MIDLSAEVESALVTQAEAHGLTPDRFIKELLKGTVQLPRQDELPPALKSGLGMWSKYGIHISDEEIAANRADMFRRFSEEV